MSTPSTSGPVRTTADVVRLLRPHGPAEPVPVPDDIAELLGTGPLAWIREMALGGTDLVAGLNPGLGGFHWDIVRLSNESSLVELLVELAGGRLALRALDAERTATVHEVLLHGVELAAVLATTRAVQRFWTTTLLDHAIDVGTPPTVLREITVTIARGIDSVVHAWSRTYPAEFDRLANTMAARRWRVIEDLLADPALVDPDLARQTMAIELDHHHTCLVVRVLAVGSAGTSDLLAAGVAALETALAATARGRRVVVHERGSDERWMWVSGPRVAPPAALRGVPIAAGLRIGVSGSHPGAAGFRRSTLEAREACRLAVRSASATLVLHEDVALVGLLSRDPERAGWFVEACLGPLAARDAQAELLRETLCAYYTSGMRLASTAAALHLHRNTLVNRLHRVEALLGHPVTDRATEVYCALLLLDVLPDLAVDRLPEP